MQPEGTARHDADPLPPADGRDAPPAPRNAPIAAVVEFPENAIARSVARVSVRPVTPKAMSARGL